MLGQSLSQFTELLWRQYKERENTPNSLEEEWERNCDKYISGLLHVLKLIKSEGIINTLRII